jgi:hypothetical protein
MKRPQRTSKMFETLKICICNKGGRSLGRSISDVGLEADRERQRATTISECLQFRQNIAFFAEDQKNFISVKFFWLN